MAEKRMFTKKVTDSDAFIEMSSAAQALYFHLNQGADDDGFNNQIQIAMMKAHASIDDLKVLMLKNFVIRFESGVIVIKHWRMHNTLRKDRYTETNFKDELAQLKLKDNGSYTLSCDDGCQVVAKGLPQISIDKNSIDKGSIGESIADESSPTPPEPKKPKEEKHKYGEYSHVLLTDVEMNKLINELGEAMYSKCITYLDEYIEMKGYKAKNHYLVIKKWVVNAVKEHEQKGKPTKSGGIDWANV